MELFIKDNNKIEVVDEKGDTLRTLDINEPKEFTPEDKFGICCAEIAEGSSLVDVATGKDFRLTVSKFIVMASGNETLNEQYVNAKRRRIDFLVEKMVQIKDEKEGKALKLLIDICKVDLEKSDESRKKVVQYRGFLSEDKQRQIIKKANRPTWK